jgi:hypothetical protein
VSDYDAPPVGWMSSGPASDTTPLRLQLGADAVGAVRAHAERLLADLAAWQAIAIGTRVDQAGSGRDAPSVGDQP